MPRRSGATVGFNWSRQVGVAYGSREQRAAALVRSGGSGNPRSLLTLASASIRMQFHASSGSALFRRSVKYKAVTAMPRAAPAKTNIRSRRRIYSSFCEATTRNGSITEKGRPGGRPATP